MERVDTRVHVALFLRAGRVDATTRNLSMRGMFIVTDAIVPVGAVFQVRVHLPSAAQDIETEVTVRWRNHEGIGVESRRAWLAVDPAAL